MPAATLGATSAASLPKRAPAIAPNKKAGQDLNPEPGRDPAANLIVFLSQGSEYLDHKITHPRDNLVDADVLARRAMILARMIAAFAESTLRMVNA
jgi:hypothetical protein